MAASVAKATCPIYDNAHAILFTFTLAKARAPQWDLCGVIYMAPDYRNEFFYYTIICGFIVVTDVTETINRSKTSIANEKLFISKS